MAHAVREVGGELLHFADGIVIRRGPPACRNSRASSGSGPGAWAGRRRRWPGTAESGGRSRDWSWRARPIMTASQLVSRTMRTRVLGSDDIAVADDRNLHRGLDLGDAGPVGLAGVALLAGAGMQRDGLQAAIFGQLGHRHGHQFVIAPAGAELHGERDGDGGAHLAQQRSTSGRSRSRPEPPLHFTTLLTGQPKLMSRISKPRSWQTRAASAMTVGSAPKSCAEMGCSSGSKAEVALQGLVGLAGFERRADAVGAGELGHDQAAAAEIADEAAEDGIGHAGHGREHGGGREGYRADRKLCGKILHGEAVSILSSEE